MPPSYRIISRVFESGAKYPAVVHTFYGSSLDQATRIFRAHMKSDAFLRDCIKKNTFADFSCREEHSCERLDGSVWVLLRCVVAL